MANTSQDDASQGDAVEGRTEQESGSDCSGYVRTRKTVRTSVEGTKG